MEQKFIKIAALCEVCGTPFRKWDKRLPHPLGSRKQGARMSTSKTCSKKCSRERIILRNKKGWKPYIQK